MKLPFIIIGVIILWSCEKDNIVEGMKPVYNAYDDYSGITADTPREFGTLGKIISTNNALFINEYLEGVHVIDNTDPSNPKKLFFWVIKGNSEFTISGNILYADNGRDLLVIDISDYAHISFVSAVKNQYVPRVMDLYPDNYIGYFECYDPAQGNIKGWVKEKLINPNCKI